MSSTIRRGKKAGSQWASFIQSQGRSARNRQQKLTPKSFAVEIPESREFYDTPSLKVALGMVAVAIAAKLTMMYDESLEEERVERKAKELVELQATPTMVSRDVWDHLQQLRPRTPFESRITRENAHIRTGESLSLEDVKDWAVDVLTDSLTRKEDSLRR